jgi:hypothetical protein
MSLLTMMRAAAALIAAAALALNAEPASAR